MLREVILVLALLTLAACAPGEAVGPHPEECITPGRPCPPGQN